jgi:hypothetical protein
VILWSTEAEAGDELDWLAFKEGKPTEEIGGNCGVGEAGFNSELIEEEEGKGGVLGMAKPGVWTGDEA